MLDIGMVLILGASFGLVYLLTVWCKKQLDSQD